MELFFLMDTLHVDYVNIVAVLLSINCLLLWCELWVVDCLNIDDLLTCCVWCEWPFYEDYQVILISLINQTLWIIKRVSKELNYRLRKYDLGSDWVEI